MLPELRTSLATVDAVLAVHAEELGADAVGYRHHVYRVVNLCVAFAGDCACADTLETAGVFHDLGIWTAGTFDYLEPSVALSEAYLRGIGRADRFATVARMIREHHKVTAYAGPDAVLVEAFRRADWVDVSAGAIAFGLPRRHIARIREHWPDAGFHRRLLGLAARRLLRHPLRPLPMLRF